MTKFEQQAADLAGVYLYKEGLFVRAYNEGAFAFIHQILACKPMRRFVAHPTLSESVHEAVKSAR